MFILISPQTRWLMTFYSVGLFLLLYYIKKHILLLLEYNSLKWHTDLYQN